MPDRLITFGGRVLFVELKATGKKPTEAQVRDHERRRAAGAEVVWLDSEEAVDTVIFCVHRKVHLDYDEEFKVVC
ncbi:VRR-NUC domain protein [compost metagenome]